MADEKRVWERVRVKFWRKTKPQFDPTARNANLVVSHGKIEIISTDGKFTTVRVKTSDVQKQPKMSQGKSTWYCMDLIQNVDAQYQAINFQVDSAGQYRDFINTLNFAWESPLDARAVFRDDADTVDIRPVHKPAPNAKPTRPNAAPPPRSSRVAISVDPEGSAASAHPAFNNDFNASQRPRQPTTEKMKEMFSDYGITDNPKSAAPPAPVHSVPSNGQQQKKKPQISYSAMANKATKDEYHCVDSAPVGSKPPMGKDGLSGISFYGEKSHPPAASPRPTTTQNNKTLTSSAHRLSTKDSIESPGALSRMSRAYPKNEAKEEARFDAFNDQDENNENLPSQKFPKFNQSLTSSSARDAFDATTRKEKEKDRFERRPVNNASRNTYALTGNNSAFKPPLASSSSYTSNNSAFPSYRGTASLSVFTYKSLYNIGNSCYMNSCLQILAACPFFVSELTRAYDSLGRKGMMHHFYELTTRLAGLSPYSTMKITTSALEKMREDLYKLDDIFEENGGKAQQDAEECLTALMGMVSDQCTGNGFKRRDSAGNRSLLSPVKTPVKRIKEESEGSPVVNEGEGERGEGVKKKKKPAVCDPVDLMEVKMRDVKKCSMCGHRIEKDAMEHRVHLGIGEGPQEGQPWSAKYVQQLLAAEVAQAETIGDFKCEKCNQTGEAIGTKDFVQFGEYIIIVLKRFGYEKGHQQLRKLKMPIRVPMYLDMTHFMNGEVNEERNPADETITLDKDNGHSGLSATLANGTQKWMEMKEEEGEEEDEESPMNTSMQQLNVSGEMVDGNEKKKKERKGGRKVMEEEEQEDVEMEEDMVQSVSPPALAVDPSDFSHRPPPSSSPFNSSMLADEGGRSGHTTPIERRGEIPFTPESGSPLRKGEKKKADLVLTPPSSRTSSSRVTRRKRGREGSSMETGDETGVPSDPRSASSLNRSEPTKRSKIESVKRSSVSESRSPDLTWMSVSADEITVIEVVPADPSGNSLTPKEKTKPCWLSASTEKEKRKSDSSIREAASTFDFDDDDEEEEGGGGGGKGRKNNRGRQDDMRKPAKQGKPFKTPLKAENGRQKDEYSPVVDEKQLEERDENARPSSRTRGHSEMEQTGGGRKRKESELDEGNMLGKAKKEEEEDEEEEEMEDDEEEVEEKKDDDEYEESSGEEDEETTGARAQNFTGRSEARKARRKEKEEEEEEEEGGWLEEDDRTEKSAVSTSRTRDGEEKGEDTHDEDEEEGTEESADEVVHGTPPEEDEGDDDPMEEGKAAVEEDEEEYLGTTIEDEEEKEEEGKDEEMEKEKETEEEWNPPGDREEWVVPDRAEVGWSPPRRDEDDIPNETDVFDRSRMEKKEDDDMNFRVDMGEDKGEVKMEGVEGRSIEEFAPSASPIKSVKSMYSVEEVKEEPVTEKKKMKDEEVEEVEEPVIELTDEEKLELDRIERNETTSAWRQIFVDTDPPPPRNHFVFRPVDEKWMKSQCKLFSLEYTIEYGISEERRKLRAQSSICQKDAVPKKTDVVECDGDGNCLFRALAWWITGTEEEHERMRKVIVEFMFNFPDVFGARMSGDAGQLYTEKDNNRMLQQGEWGTHCEIYGAATLFGVDIYTFHAGSWKAYRPLFEWTRLASKLEFTRKINLDERTRFGIYLTNPLNYHYDVVKYMEPVAPKSDSCYRLLATLLHRGSTAHSGHYVADVFDQKKKQWLHCDDSAITERSVIEVLQSAMNEGYVLVYGKNSSVENESVA